MEPATAPRGACAVGPGQAAFQTLLSAVESERAAAGGSMPRRPPACLASSGGAFAPYSAPPSAASSHPPGLAADKGTQQGPGQANNGFQPLAPISLLHAPAPTSAFNRPAPAPQPRAAMGHHPPMPYVGGGFPPALAWAASPAAAAPAALGPSGLPVSMHRAVFPSAAAGPAPAFTAAPPAAPVAATPISTPLPVPAISAMEVLRAKAAPAPGAAGACSTPAVGLLPGVPFELQDPMDGPKPKRAARANLQAFTAEQKQERRKERARVYSAIARERQEAQMKDLKQRVEALSVFRLIVEESPDMVCVVTPDREARILFVNDACGRVLQREPAELVSKPLWEVLHPDDKHLFLTAFSETILSRDGIGKVQCRILSGGADAAAPAYMHASMSMRKGTQGVISIVRPLGVARVEVKEEEEEEEEEDGEDEEESSSRNSCRTSTSTSTSSSGSEGGVRAGSQEE